MSRDESKNLSVWLRYYKKHFAPEDIYVLDHGSSDGSTLGLDVAVIPIHNETYNDNQWIVDTAKQMQAQLLSRYRYVLFAHPDEFVVADPDSYPGGLKEYLARNTQEVVRCSGMNVVQHLVREPSPLDWDRPILAQRRWWYPFEHSCKPLLASRPLNWTWGFHWDMPPEQVGSSYYARIERPVDPKLLLLHLHGMDQASMLARHAWMRQQAFHDQGEAGFHHRWSDEEVLASFRDCQPLLQPIPDRFDGGIL